MAMNTLGPSNRASSVVRLGRLKYARAGRSGVGSQTAVAKLQSTCQPRRAVHPIHLQTPARINQTTRI